MDCNAVEEKLSAYLDGVLSSGEHARIDEHLGSCQHCRAALHELRETTAHLANLEEVEPPDWLAQKIMARVRAEAGQKKGVLRKLVSPRYITLPIGAVATIAIAVTTLYIFKSTQPEIKLAQAPSKEFSQVRGSGEKEPPEKGREEKDRLALPSPPGAGRSLTEKPEERLTPDREAGTGRDHDETVPRVVAPPELREELPVQKAPAPVPRGDDTSVAGVARDEVKQEARQPSSGLKAMARGGEEIATLKVRVKDIETAGKEIEKMIGELGGEVRRRDFSKGRTTLILNIETARMKELHRKLMLIGEIKDELPAGGGDDGIREIRIQIESAPFGP